MTIRKYPELYLYLSDNNHYHYVITNKEKDYELYGSEIDMVENMSINEYITDLISRGYPKERISDTPEIIESESDLKPCKALKSLLINCHKKDIRFITLPAGNFDIEYLLTTDDKDEVTFHKSPNTPVHCMKMKVCDYETTGEPIWKDWYMTINYHS